MAKVFLGLGSNLGDRKENLERACRKISTLGTLQGISSIYETPALLPDRAPASWNEPYLNLVVEIQFSGAPFELLGKLQSIELQLGRIRDARWAPRTLDIDILFWEGVQSSRPELLLPHPGLAVREFVLDPLAELSPDLLLASGTIRELSRVNRKHKPRLMGVLNLTPDSFSDGGLHTKEEKLLSTLKEWDSIGVGILDVGAESTRPGGKPISSQEEWERLSPTLNLIQERYEGKFLRPLLSVDTRHADTALKALELQADMINDVSGLADPKMLKVILESDCQYVLMHSLSIPANSKVILPEDEDPMTSVLNWMRGKLEILDQAGITRRRITVDPGIGFGKTALQSLALLKGAERLSELGCGVLIGHSRKSFLQGATTRAAEERDIETLGVSFSMLSKKVDILRVHNPMMHHRAMLAWGHTQ